MVHSMSLLFLFSLSSFFLLSWGATINVATTAQLKTAFTSVTAGDTIIIAPDVVITCSGNFMLSKNGTENQRITVQGSGNSIIQCPGIDKNYVLYLNGASYVTVKNLTLRTGKKGVMVDRGFYNILENLEIYNIGEEAVHFRDASSYNTIQNSFIHDAGVLNPSYGEGVYVGSDVGKWEEFEKACDHTQIINNTIGPNVSAESIDIKEGSSFTLVKGNVFNASGISGENSADSWIDVKGNNCTITQNTGYQAGVVDTTKFYAGYQTHQRATGWGFYNIFSKNIGVFEASFTGFLIDEASKTTNNIVCNDNSITGGGSITNTAIIDCSASSSSSSSSSSTGESSTTTSSSTSGTPTETPSPSPSPSSSPSPSPSPSSSPSPSPSPSSDNDGAATSLGASFVYCFLAIIFVFIN